MKRKTKRMGALLLSAAAAAALLMPLARADTRITDELTILFTHDTHSHFLLSDDGDGAYGGYTRLATLLAEQRDAAEAAGRACVTLDGGDFSMGSLFQTIYTTQAAELRTLSSTTGARDWPICSTRRWPRGMLRYPHCSAPNLIQCRSTGRAMDPRRSPCPPSWRPTIPRRRTRRQGPR